MKRVLLALFLCASVLYVKAAGPVSVMISDGIDNKAVASRMESGLSALLTEINRAVESGRSLNYSGLNIPSDVQDALDMLWDNSPFEISESVIVEHCLTTSKGYQIRNIPLFLKPKPNSGYEGDDYQEAVVSFDKNGNINNFNLSISTSLIGPILKNGKDLTDLRRRELILDYVEQFRTSYNQKDINFLDAVFSDDALIITGKVVQRRSGDMKLPDKVVYNKQTKTQYLSKLKQVFAANKHIRVTFDEVEIVRHPANVDFYGVTLHQGWTTDHYHDDGYVFLLWDFRDEEHPQIHVRTWQPDAYNSDGRGTKRISKDEIFSFDDFDI